MSSCSGPRDGHRGIPPAWSRPRARGRCWNDCCGSG
jgi:hypothetical protein